MSNDLKPLTLSNFFPHLIIHPKNSIVADRDWTWAASIILGIFTLGLIHVGCAIAERCITQKDKEESPLLSSTNAVGERHLNQEKTGEAEAREKTEQEAKEKAEAEAREKTESKQTERTIGREKKQVIPPMPPLPTSPPLAVSSTTTSSTTQLSSIAITSDNPEVEIPYKWKRNVLLRNSAPEGAPQQPLQPPQPLILPKLWTLKDNGQLNDVEAEKQFISALQFLDQNPIWIKDEANAAQVTAFFIALAKTSFSQSPQVDTILPTYQSILSQHEEHFLKVLIDTDISLLIQLKLEGNEVFIPRNLLASQSSVYQVAVEGRFKNEKVIDLGSGQSEEVNTKLAGEFGNLISYLMKGEIAIHSNNVLTLLDYADRNQITHLKEGCLKFLAASFDVDDPESFSPVSQFIAERGLLIAPLTEEICREICEVGFYGKAEWKKYFGDPGDVPALPPNIVEILTAKCPIFPGKKVCETHMLALVVEKIDDVPLTFKQFTELAKKPKEGSGGHPVEIKHRDALCYPENYESVFKESHWVLVTKDVIPGSQGKYYGDDDDDDETKIIVQAICKKSGLPYELSSIYDIIPCSVMQHVGSEKSLFNGFYTLCKENAGEEGGDGKIIVKCPPHDPSRNAVISIDSTLDSMFQTPEDTGMVVSRRLS